MPSPGQCWQNSRWAYSEKGLTAGADRSTVDPPEQSGLHKAVCAPLDADKVPPESRSLWGRQAAFAFTK